MNLLNRIACFISCVVLANGITPTMARMIVHGEDPPLVPMTDPLVNVDGVIGTPEPPQSLGLQLFADLQAPILEDTLCVTDQTTPWFFALKSSPIGTDAAQSASSPNTTDPITWQPADWHEFDFTTLEDQTLAQTVPGASGRGWLVIGTLTGPCGSATITAMAATATNSDTGLQQHVLIPIGPLDEATVEFFDAARQLNELLGFRNADGSPTTTAGTSSFDCLQFRNQSLAAAMLDYTNCLKDLLDVRLAIACTIACLAAAAVFAPAWAACALACAAVVAIQALAVYAICSDAMSQAAATIAAAYCTCLEGLTRSTGAPCVFPELNCSCADAADDCLDCEDTIFPLLDMMGLSSCVNGGCP